MPCASHFILVAAICACFVLKPLSHPTNEFQIPSALYGIGSGSTNSWKLEGQAANGYQEDGKAIICDVVTNYIAIRCNLSSKALNRPCDLIDLAT